MIACRYYGKDIGTALEQGRMAACWKGVLIVCGFVGMFNRDASLNDEKLLTTMSHTIRHRGPDESDYIVRDSFCVAFRRLSIIDLDTGSQPYTSPMDGLPPSLMGRSITIVICVNRCWKRVSSSIPIPKLR